MLIKINTHDSDYLESIIETLKQEFNVGTASKAVALTATAFKGCKVRLDDAEEKIEYLEAQLNELVNAYSDKLEADRTFQRILDLNVRNSPRALVSDMGLTSQASKGLNEIGVITLSDLLERSEVDILRANNIGSLALTQIKDTLAKTGLSLRTF